MKLAPLVNSILFSSNEISKNVYFILMKAKKCFNIIDNALKNYVQLHRRGESLQ